MKVLFYLGHPAHFHLFCNLFSRLQKNGDEIYITIKTKDILENLLKESGYNYSNIYPVVRKQNKFSILTALLVKNFRLMKIVKNFRPDLMMGTSIEIAEVGKIMGVPAVIVNEDDFDVVPQFALLGYPFAAFIIAPTCCRIGKWSHKKIAYEGYHELAYLNEASFIPDENYIKNFNPNLEPYFLLRFSRLTAYHDDNITGINVDFAMQIIKKLRGRGRVYISSENELDPELEKYRLNANPKDIHHVMYFADIYIGDSQTMAAEAAVLGTPGIRYNDFVGRIGYLEELEHKYGLTYGIKPDSPNLLLQKIDELLAIEKLKVEWKKRRDKMLAEKIDVTQFLLWFVQNYPGSAYRVVNNNGIFTPDLIEKEIAEVPD